MGHNPSFPQIYNVANFLAESELKRVEALVRAKGEEFIISIAVVNPAKVQVTAGNNGFEASSGRLYKIDRQRSDWEIVEVTEWVTQE